MPSSEENHIIRIILEGKDLLSGSFTKGRQNLNRDIEQVRTGIVKLDKTIKDADRDIGTTQLFGGKKGVRGLGGAFTTIEKANQDLDKLRLGLKKLNQENSTFRDLFRGFRGGLQEARDIGKEIQESLGLSQAQIRQKRQELDTDIRNKQFQAKIDKDNAIADLKEKLNNEDKLKRQKIANLEFFRREAVDENKARNASDKAFVQSQINRAVALRKSVASKEIAPLQSEREAIGKKKDLQARKLALKIEIDEIKRKQNIDVEAIKAAGKTRLDAIRAADREETARVNKQVGKIVAATKTEFADRRREANAALEEEFRQRALAIQKEQHQRRAVLAGEDVSSIRARILEQRSLNDELFKSESRLTRFGRVSGSILGDFKRGISEGRRGLVDFGSEAQKAETRMTRLGQSVGRAIGQFRNLVNLRWFFLTTAIQFVGTLVTQLVAAFISLTASATLAASAIGAAFTAAASQAAPVIGLFVAASARIQSVLKAVQLQNQNKIAVAAQDPSKLTEQERKRAQIAADQSAIAKDRIQQLTDERERTEQLADSQFNLRRAYLAVSDARFNLVQSGEAVTQALQEHADAIKNLTQTRIDVSRGIVDANFKERQAALDLQQAELGVVDAKKQLLAIEKQQRQDQADIEAAQGAVREARQRLAVARAEGDEAATANARAQLAVAQQSLSTIKNNLTQSANAIKSAKLDVKEAQLAKDRATVEAPRARQDAAKARSEGIKGNQQVIDAERNVLQTARGIRDARREQVSATRQLRDALHDVAVQQREIRDNQIDFVNKQKDAQNQLKQDQERLKLDRADLKNKQDQTIAGQRQLNALLKELSPAERRLYQAFIRLQNLYRRAFRPITDIIVDAITRATERISVLLQDPKILFGFRRLADQMAIAIDRISKFIISPRVREDILFFLNHASRNMPKIVDAFLKLADALLQLSKAGTPIFDKFVGFIDKLATSLDKFLNNKKKSDSFFSLAKDNLDSWIKLAATIGKTFLLLGQGSHRTGRSLIEDLAGQPSRRTRIQGPGPAGGQIIEQGATGLTALNEFLEKNPDKVRKFFEDMRIGLEGLVKAFSRLLPLFKQAFASEDAEKFAQFTVEIFIPALLLLIQTIQQATKVLLFFVHLPVIGNVILWIAKILIMEKALNRVFPVTQKLTNLIKLALFGALRSAGRALAYFVGWIGRFVALARVVGITEALAAAFPRIAKGLALVRTGVTLLAARIPFLFGPWGILIAAIITAIILLDRKFHFIQPTIKKVREVAENVFNWIKKNWKLLAAIILGPFTLVAFAITKWRGKIIGFFQDIIDWVKNHWKLLVKILIAVFLFPAGPVAVALFHFKDKILGLFKAITDGIVDFFRLLPGRILNAMKGIPRQIIHLFTGLGEKVLREIVGKIPGLSDALGLAGKVIGAAAKVGSAVKGVGAKAKDRITGLFRAGGGITPRGTDTVPAMLTPGEWVLNLKQQSKLAQIFGTGRDQIANYLFGSAALRETNPPRRAAGFTGSAFNRLNKGPHSVYNSLEGPGFRLTPHQDEDGHTIWFAEFGDKTYGQISPKDAVKILASNGQFIPSYLSGAGTHHGGLLPGRMHTVGRIKALTNSGYFRSRALHASGGIVQSLARGGPVMTSPHSTNGRGGNAITQHFNVKTEGETDWNYVMRLGAIHAQESY